ncbi:hypothetical protein P171DRAFT_203132 [Karstenula rhodostoma CBS 690.94]|uniref:Uncharacterized protein n=1 Tax=Karstenula rhodostoma CBS 690.94 TaxID=1392251 RepID=A0A9P4PRG3_9PLEO|nr:hypothetical protein P171DRAFT_203132 [Karstenula rhodostoma CBS 690.94]
MPHRSGAAASQLELRERLVGTVTEAACFKARHTWRRWFAESKWWTNALGVGGGTAVRFVQRRALHTAIRREQDQTISSQDYGDDGRPQVIPPTGRLARVEESDRIEGSVAPFHVHAQRPGVVTLLTAGRTSAGGHKTRVWEGAVECMGASGRAAVNAVVSLRQEGGHNKMHRRQGRSKKEGAVIATLG